MRPAKILFIGEYIGFFGGIERYAYQTALELRRNGFDVFYSGTTEAKDAPVFSAAFSGVLSREESVVDKNYSLVVLHKLCPFEYLETLRRNYGERLVFFAHDHDVYCPRRHYYTPFGRTNCRRSFSRPRCAVCSALSNPKGRTRSVGESAKLLAELRGRRAVVISNFMRENLANNGFAKPDIFLVPPFAESVERRKSFFKDGVLRILFMGQLIKGKGVDLLLEAAARLKIPFELTIAGDGSDAGNLKKLAAKLRLAEKTMFASWVSDTSALFEDADLLAFPSRWQEPFGLVGLESISRGVPAVGFAVGGVGEWLKDSVSGFSVPERDTAQFAAAIEKFFNGGDSSLALRLGESSADFAERNFSRSEFLKSFKNLLES